jgi:hypothetical protein
MMGAEAGFDMQSQEGLDEWMHTIQGIPLPGFATKPPACREPLSALCKRRRRTPTLTHRRRMEDAAPNRGCGAVART